jgi:hypothetical protein
MQELAVAAAVALLISVGIVSARVVVRLLMPNRREMLRLQNERIERTLREEADLEMGER